MLKRLARGASVALVALGASVAFVALGAIVALGLSVTAQAADRYDGRHDYPSIVWTGFYFGGGLGARWTDATWRTDSVLVTANPPDPATAVSTLNSSGFRAALHAGYNWQLGNWVWGIESDLGAAKNERSQTGFPGVGYGALLGQTRDVFTAKTGWDGSVRLRGGMLVSPSVLLYATGGLALQQATLSMSCQPNPVPSWCGANRSENPSKTLTGWTIGAGVEAALTKHWFARAEYRYSDFGKFNNVFLTGVVDDTITGGAKFDTHVVNFGLHYKF